MEEDYIDLCHNNIYYREQFNSNEGVFSLLPPELRREIFDKIDNHSTMIICSMVNHRWYKEMQIVLYEHCVRKGILTDLPFWQNHANKDWKWLLRCSIKLTSESGIGTLESDKGIYTGECQNNKKCGWGKMQWKNGGFYQGHWIDNTKDGFGYQKWGIGTKWNGDIYEGQWVKSKREGTGIYIWSTGDRYEGQWKDGRKEGIGSFRFFKSGNRYEGEYKNDSRNGNGTFYWANGDVYSGEWFNSEKQGIGSYTWSSGEIYKGQWDKSERSGFGQFIWTNGSRYEGEWVGNRMQGIGTYHWPDGDRFEGKWSGNRRIEGRLIMANGRVEEQNWNERDVNRSEIKNVVLKKFPDCFMEE